MARSTLPAPVLEALEECIKAAELHGEAGAGHHGHLKTFQLLQHARQAVVRAIEEHTSAMYEGGIEMGRAQGGGQR